MLKKWKKTLKFLFSIIFLLVYVTVDRYNRETLRAEKSKKSMSFGDHLPPTDDKVYPGTVKTIVGYSKEFRLRQELNDRIDCRETRKRPRTGNGNDQETANKWIRDRKLGIKLFSAYYDRRQDPYRYVRIIGLLPRNSTLYCQIWYEEGNETMSRVTQKAVIREIWSRSWGQNSGQCEEDYPSLISCLAPTENGTKILPPPSWVSFVDGNCSGDEENFVKIASNHQNRDRTPKPDNFLICVKPLHFTNVNLNTFREWLDINRRLGAERIVVYLTNSTQMNSSMFSGDSGRILSVKKFQVPEEPDCPARNFEESIWHRRKMEIIAYNDCFYSNLDRSEFLIPLDVDEIIVPKTGNNWFEAFRIHFRTSGNALDSASFPPENYASFSVRNAYFFSDYPNDAIFLRAEPSGTPTPTKLPNNPKTNVPLKLVNRFRAEKGKLLNRDQRSIFDRIVRSYRLSPNSDSVKSFVRVAKTLSVFNHYTFHVLDDESDQRQYIFPESVFQLNHYRNSCDPVLIDGCEDFLNHVVYDDSLEKFRNRTNESTSRYDEASLGR